MGWLGRLVMGAATAVAVIGTMFVVAEAVLLPATRCLVARETVEGLTMPRSYAEVRHALGCDGEPAGRDDWGPIVRETFRWRGDAWPYGVFEGVFYNGMLHAKNVRWIALDLDLRPPAAAATTPSGAAH